MSHIRVSVNGEVRRMWLVMYQHLPGMAKETHENSRLAWVRTGYLRSPTLQGT
jgi:hypothetical protein